MENYEITIKNQLNNTDSITKTHKSVPLFIKKNKITLDFIEENALELHADYTNNK